MDGVRQATLDDWAEAKELWLEFEKSPHYWKIEGNLASFSSYFAASLVMDYLKCFLVFFNTKPVGFCIITESIASNINSEGFQVVEKQSFIRAVYIRPGTPRRLGRELDNILDKWGKFRDHKCRFGNCRLDFPTKGALEAYGYAPKAIVMSKEIR